MSDENCVSKEFERLLIAPIHSLDLGDAATNCLVNKGLHSLYYVVTMPLSDFVRLEQWFGRRSFGKILGLLAIYEGLNVGMKIEVTDSSYRIVDPGVDPIEVFKIVRGQL